MKKSIFFFVSALFMALSLQAQTPEKFNYQGIARDNNGEPMANQLLGIRIKILDGSTAVYTETHHPTTNDFGLYTLAIGDGTPIAGTMGNVDWSTGNKFINIAIDPYGGTSYNDIGTTELLSVPYAMYAKSSGGGGGGGNPTGAAGGDLTGTYPDPVIANGAVTTTKIADNAITSTKVNNASISTNKLSNGAVTSQKIDAMGATDGQVLKFDGTNWVPGTDDGGSAGTTYTAGDGIGISTTNEISADISTNELQDGAVTSPKIGAMGATSGQFLKFDGTNWVPANVTGGGAGDDWGSQVTEITDRLSGDGTSGNPLDIAQQSASDGQVLKWNGATTTWEPANDETATSGSGDDWGAQTVETDATLEGEGTTATPLGIADGAITSSKINDMSATNGQVLKFDGTNWMPGNDIEGTSGTTYTAGDGIAISGSNEIIADLGTDIETAELQDVAVTTPKIANDAITSDKINDNAITSNKVTDGAITSPKIDGMGATNGQVLKFDGTNWMPGNDIEGTAGTTYTAGDGIAISGTNEIIADLGTDIETAELQDAAVTTPKIADDAITSEKVNDGAISTAKLANAAVTTLKIDDNAITSPKIDAMGATNGQVLKFDGTNWMPGNDIEGTSGTTYTAGDGIAISGTNEIIADLGTDIETAELQDAAVTTPKIADDAITSDKVSDGAITSPKIDQMSASNGQVLKWNGTNWVPSNDETGGGGAGDDWGSQVVQTNTTLEGEGIASDPLGIADNAITTIKLNNGAVTSEKIDPMGATNGQILKFNGTNWIPEDETASTGDDWGTQVTETDVTLTGDGTPGNELGLAQNGATDGQILTWDDTNTNWTPTDQTTGADAFFEADATKISYTDTGDFDKDLLFNTETVDFTGSAFNYEYKMMFLPSKSGAFRAGAIDVDSWDFTNIGEASVAFGDWTEASGTASTAMGWGTQASGDYSIAMGYGSKASSYSATAIGSYSKAEGSYSTAMGKSTRAPSYSETSIGSYNTDYTPVSDDSFETADRQFTVGIGENAGARADGFMVMKSGLVTAPELTNTLIDSDPQALVTKQYLDDNASTDGWALDGNAVTATDFIGTTNEQDLRFKANGKAMGFISAKISGEGSNNIAFGYHALNSNTTGYLNIASGNNALLSNTTGPRNIAIGGSTLSSNISGSDNIAVGTFALMNNETSGLIAIGQDALRNNTDGNWNTALGRKALMQNTIGSRNTALGGVALTNNQLGEENTAVGVDAMQSNTDGNQNTAIGRGALKSNTTGHNNTALGYNAYVSTGNLTNATAIGSRALVAQNNSMVLGSINGVNDATADTKVGIGTTTPAERLHVVGNELLEGQLTIKENANDYSKIYFKNGNNDARWTLAGHPKTDGASSLFNFYYNDGAGTGRDVMQISGQGRVGINHTPNGEPFNEGTLSIKQLDMESNLSLINSSGSSKWGFEILSSGEMSLFFNGGQKGNFDPISGAYYTTSDRRLKENIAPTPSVLGKVQDIKIMNYNFKSDKTQRSQIGYIAQELEKQFPEFVNKPEKDSKRETYYTVNYAGMSAVAIKAIQEQQETIEAQADELKEVHKQLDALEARLSALEKQ